MRGNKAWCNNELGDTREGIGAEKVDTKEGAT